MFYLQLTETDIKKMSIKETAMTKYVKTSHSNKESLENVNSSDNQSLYGCKLFKWCLSGN